MGLMLPNGPVTGIAEIVLWSHDLEKSYAFYRDIFGLTMMEQPDAVKPRFLLAAEGKAGVPQMIVLVPHPDPAAAFPAEKPRRPLHHLAFAVAADGYEELAARCRDAGLEVRDGIHPVLRDVRTFYVDDPDGNEVEVIGPQDPAQRPSP
jgi:catechol 2,3-dioxygenase-like lactoylglutathione lyase family enzyme